ncbi:MAG: twin-arginine translocase subunit TatC, partial [Desulfarculus sp.]|nr:twin-arginine translocase subunit TatC [Desulfarculus sp.]
MPEPEEAPKTGTGQEAEQPAEGEGAFSKMHFMEHLDELRVRLIRSGYDVLGAFVVAFFFKEHLYDLLKKPLQPYLPAGAKLIYTASAELFFT